MDRASILTFRRAASGVRVNGDWSEPAVVRNNRFVDDWHAVSINGHTVHLLDNEVSVLDPDRVPFFGFPWDGIKISPPALIHDLDTPMKRTGNLVAGNHIEGHIGGIRVEIHFPGPTCRRNVIRDNTIVVARVHNPMRGRFSLVDETDSTFVGVPISILSEPATSVRCGTRSGSSARC